MTGTGLIVGTPGFIAPEVIVGAVNDDPRSDLYALGVMWFEMVTGARPFEANTPFALAMKHVQEQPPRPNSIRPFSPIPAPVEDAIVRLLEKSPEQRPGSAMALAGVIAHLIDVADNPVEPSSSQVRTRPDLRATDATETGFSPLPSLSPKTAPPTSVIDAPPSAPSSTSSGRGPVLLAGVVVLAVLAAIVAVIATRPTTAPPPPPPVAPTPVTPTPVTPPPTTPVAPSPVTPTPVTPPTTPVAPSPVETPTSAPPAPTPAPTATKKPVTHKPQLLLD